LLAALVGATAAVGADAAAPVAAPALTDFSLIENPQAPSRFSLIEEVRLGAFAHNPHDDERAPVDASFETLSSPIAFGRSDNVWLNAFMNPRLNFGGMINTQGRDSYGFTGLTWRFPLFDRLFFEGEFGGEVNNAPTHRELHRVDLGCHETFRESGGLGYHITSNVDVVASVEHVSHADLCGSQNPGLTNFGLRIGYKF
jgi:hypothetical protein